MNWLKRLVVKWVREDWDDGRYSRENDGSMMAIGMPRKRGTQVGLAKTAVDISDLDNPMRFELNSAVGGRILTVRQYDPKHDRHESTVYVIPSGEDVGARVAKIMNLELLK